MIKIIITCEHGGNNIPERYTDLFIEHQEILDTHRGWDIGALRLARAIFERLGDYFFYSEISRLLVDLNRSRMNVKFSEMTRSLDQAHKNSILEEFYVPYRDTLKHQISELVKEQNKVVHISIHSFTPSLNGKIRNADIGFLYDSRRMNEKHFCSLWKENLFQIMPIRIRFNYPYRGKTVGLVAYLRKKFSPDNYLGLELEVNQRFFLTETEQYDSLKNSLISSLSETIVSYMKTIP